MSLADEKIKGIVSQYTYRSARVRDVFLRVPRDTVRALEEQLAQAANARVDNHTVYVIMQPDCPPVYISFSDFTATFGSSVLEEHF
jgi:hypothetical protein